jgi:glycosyltransferase involved in cell wall biosynthesis
MFYAGLAGNLLSPLPYSVAKHTSRAMRQAVEGFAASNPVDLWQFEWTPYLDTLRDPAARKLLIAHNVDTLIWQRYHEAAIGWLKRWYIRQQWRKFERFEKRAFVQASRVVAVSPPDAALIRERFGQSRVDVVENGIDRAYFESVQRSPAPRAILFLGALDWRPNLDGVEFLLNDILPRLRSRLPDARLQIVGRRPPSHLAERVKRIAGVELHADVADVRPFLACSSVMVVPLRIGGGSRLKILESLAAGLPVVSTTVGAEGLELEPGKDFLRADTAEELARMLADCLENPGPCQAMATRARSGVLGKYDWDTLAAKLETVWEKCVAVRGLARV